MNGNFVISLDYELMWGVRDKKSKEDYGSNIVSVNNVINDLLKYFETYNINATFATVGFLFFDNKKQLDEQLPSLKPTYDDKNLSPYNGYIHSIKNLEQDLLHFASKDIDKIKSCCNHEISTHTFSHYYCLEPGQKLEQFKHDIKSAIKIAKQKGVDIKTIVFPRNQFNEEYRDLLISQGIKAYRGNEKSWFYKERNGQEETLLRRLMRLIDTYINISGNHCYKINTNRDELTNIPSSRFLRPYNPKLKLLEKFRIRRITQSMTYAAKNGMTYHLWWHPHNFGSYKEENFKFLETILNHYKELNKRYNFKSVSMKELVDNKEL